MEEKKPSSAPDFNHMEQETLRFWNENNTFQKSLEQTKHNTPYVFYDGPPFATGLPHYGSLLPSILKDTFPRYRTMKGEYVRRRWGWDCHGLPIENIVEQQLHISGKKQIEALGVEKFNEACRQDILKYAREWKTTIDRIARWVEFDNAYMTMQTSYMESVWWALSEIWKKDLIYEDRKVLLYCSRCETPISNFEVAMDNSYRDVTENSVFVKFKILPHQRIVDDLTDDKTYALAWTTTPWTLPGNTALNIAPGITYVLVEQNDEKYLLAKDRLEILEGEYQIIRELDARQIEGLDYEPLFPGVIENTNGRAHRIYSEAYVTTTDGTGIVHNAAMYGEEDYEAAKRRDLPRKHVLDEKGHYIPAVGAPLAGMFFKNADKVVLEMLGQQSRVYKILPFTHAYPHCHRCGTPLFYNALSAWFINIQKVKSRLLEENEKVNWYPEHLKHGRFVKGIESAPDWNISRNRYWATPLPFWKCTNKQCKNVECIGSIEALKTKSRNFSEVYPQYDPNNLDAIDLHRPFIDKVILSCSVCNSDMLRIPEVVDCWVESGSMPFAELHYPFVNQQEFEQRFPSDFIVEYIPQTRAWFYVLHVISVILFDKAPFKNVLTTGTILAEDGTKMSKSKKNYPDPNTILEKYGADALRFYLLTTPVVNGEDLNFSESGVSEVNRKMNLLLYNVWSFYRMYSPQPLDDSTVPVVSHVLDSWVLTELAWVAKRVTDALDAYDTKTAGKVLLDWVNDVSTWYVRRSRDRLKEKNTESESGLRVYGYVLAKTAQLLAPFMPYLAEAIYRDVTKKESVHLTAWPQLSVLPEQESLRTQMAVVREVVSIGHQVRKTSSLSVRQALASVGYELKEGELSAPLLAIIAEELNVKQVVPAASLAGKSEVATGLGQGVVTRVLLDTALTPELKLEGSARELERAVQDLRKKSQLQVGELVDLYYNAQDEALEKALLELFDRKKTFVNQINKSLEVEVDFEIQATVGGVPIWLGLMRV